jgi:hypothetical protein
MVPTTMRPVTPNRKPGPSPLHFTASGVVDQIRITPRYAAGTDMTASLVVGGGFPCPENKKATDISLSVAFPENAA